MFIKQKNYSRHSIIFTWLLSYISILLVPVVISGIGYIESSKTFEKEISHVNMGLLKQIQQGMDSRLTDIEKIAQQISINPKVRTLANAQKPISNFQQYNINKMVEDLKIISATNGFIDDMFIFFKGTDSIVNAHTHIGFDLFYQHFNQFQDQPFEYWLHYLHEIHTKEYIVVNQKNNSGDITKKLAYVQSVFIDNSGDSYATLVIMIDGNRFHENIQNLQLVNLGLIMIVDSKNNVITTTQPLATIPNVEFEKMKNASGMYNGEINNEKVVISYISSEISSWKYVALIPTRVFWSKMSSLKKIFYYTLLLSLLIGSIVVYIILKRNYNPVNNLLQTVTEKKGIPFSTEANEYVLIQEVFSKTYNENKTINEKLNLHNSEVKSNIIKKLLKGRFENQCTIEDTLTAFDIYFQTPFFAVLLFSIDNTNDFFAEEKDLSNHEKTKLLKFIMTNVVEELAGQNNQGYMIEIDDDTMVCLVNCRENNTESVQHELYNIVETMQQFIQSNFYIYFTTAISSVHETLAGIPKAYEEAIEVMEYRIVIGGTSIISHKDISFEREHKNNYEYSLETEYKLINSIKAGAFSEAQTILLGVFASNFDQEHISVQIARCLMFDLVGTIIKTMNEIRNICDNFVEDMQITERLLQCDTIPDMKILMTDVLRQVCNTVRKNKKSSHKDLIKNIIAYINENYHNYDLCISLLGDVLEMSPSYIGGIFKEEMGEGILDYMNKVRVENAKKLLAKTQLSIQEIAAAVGYASSNVFIRTFKKCEGVTPGKFREIYEEGN